MKHLLPSDIEDFLADIGACRDKDPLAFMAYAQTAAALLFDKYVILEDPTLDIMPAPRCGRWWSGRAEPTKKS